MTLRFALLFGALCGVLGSLSGYVNLRLMPHHVPHVIVTENGKPCRHVSASTWACPRP